MFDTGARAAFLQTQVACMLAEMEAMKVENAIRKEDGYAPAYGPDMFRALPDGYGLGHNTVVSYLQDGA